MNLFASQDEVALLETRMALLCGDLWLEAASQLAWYVRHRDHVRALALADEAKALIEFGGVEPSLGQRVTARLALVRGEIGYEFFDLDTAINNANFALAVFEGIGDQVGVGDAGWLLTTVWATRGDEEKAQAFLAQSLEKYRKFGDQTRIDACLARGLFISTFTDTKLAAQNLAQAFASNVPCEAGALPWVASARAQVSAYVGDDSEAIRQNLIAQQAAQDLGHLPHAVLCACNGAIFCANLGDLDGALEWLESTLVLARSSGLLRPLSATLIQTGHVLSLLARHDEAKLALTEGLKLRRGLDVSNTFVLATHYLGEIALDEHDPARALQYFDQAEAMAETFRQPVLSMMCWRGQADALLALAEPECALHKILASLALAQQEGNLIKQVDALQVLARIHQKHSLQPPLGVAPGDTVLHFLNQAVALAKSIPGYSLSPEILDEMAVAHAAQGDFQLAYEKGRMAASVRDGKRRELARNRAISMRIRNETEKALAEAEYHRQAARNEVQRVEKLQEFNSTLEILGLVGREITSCLNQADVFATLNRHANQLLDAESFFVDLLEPDGTTLRSAFAIESGEVCELDSVSIDDSNAISARCARERQEIAVDVAPEGVDHTAAAGTLYTLSLLYAPLQIGERLLGVMSIQSVQAGAYGDRERSIFRALAAYGAIALDNATAYATAERARLQAGEAMVELDEAKTKMADLAAWLSEEVHKATTEMLLRERETVIRLAKAAEFRDPETGAHILRMAHYSALIARGMGLSLSDQELLLEAAPMHDIGKVGVADHILLKPGRLTPEEMETMKQHAAYGYEILKGSSSRVLRAGADIARGHHEKFDGSGYPNGISGQDIPIFSRIVAVADVFDALTSERPYKKAWALNDAVAFINAKAGSHFDPDCVASFIEHWDEVLDIRLRFQDEN